MGTETGRDTGTDTDTDAGAGSALVARTGGDPVLKALDELAEVLEANARDERLLAARIRSIAASRNNGSDWFDVLAAEDEPGTLQLVSGCLARLSAGSGAFRKSLAVELREEGNTIPSIARLFGVTHQRVSNLLRQAKS